MQTLVVIWSIVTLFFLILEIGHPNLFFFLSFASGAGVAALVVLLSSDISFSSQLLIFFLASAVSFMMLRKVAARLNARLTKTNIYALEGQVGIVVKEIDPHSFGQVRVVNEVWLARTIQDRFIPVGAYVRVVKVQGAHVIVDVIEHHFH